MVNVEPGKIKQPGKPGHYGDDVKGLDPEHGGIQSEHFGEF